MSKSWEGSWRTRIPERLANHGFESLTDYADAHPTWSFSAIAGALGDDVAPILVIKTLVVEARASQREAAHFVADWLSRIVPKHLPNGWRRGEKVEFRTAGVYADLASMLQGDKEFARLACDELERLSPPAGWLPSGPGDPLIVAACRVLGSRRLTGNGQQGGPIVH